MTEIVKETITTQGVVTTPVVHAVSDGKATQSQTIEYFIYFLFGMLEILLAFRLILKLMGASTTSTFVRLIYSLSGIFIMPFEGIFRRGFTQGLETTSVIEPSTLVAMLVFAVVAWGIVWLVRISSGEQQSST